MYFEKRGLGISRSRDGCEFRGTDCMYDTTINSFVLNSSRVIAPLNIRGPSWVLAL